MQFNPKNRIRKASKEFICPNIMKHKFCSIQLINGFSCAFSHSISEARAARIGLWNVSDDPNSFESILRELQDIKKDNKILKLEIKKLVDDSAKQPI